MKTLLNREQYEGWLRNIPQGTCTFCDKDYQVVLHEFDHWLWVANIAPYWYWHTMIIPKRHFVEFDEMSFKESSELPTVLAYTKKKFIDANLTRKEGDPVEKFVYFWRYRMNKIDKISGTVRPDHFHLHIAPDKDHLWDPTLDDDAYKCDIVKALGDNI